MSDLLEASLDVLRKAIRNGKRSVKRLKSIEDRLDEIMADGERDGTKG